MKAISLLGLVFGAVIALSPTVSAQEADFTISSSRFEDRGRPGVEFAHEEHGERFECGRCHHEFDEYLNNIDDEGRTCDSCHGKPDRADLIGLQKAFHGQCRACHMDFIERDGASGPVTCGGCHRRR